MPADKNQDNERKINMKTYKITVNGSVYDVAVEEVGGAVQAPVANTAPAAVPVAPAAAAAPVKPAAAVSVAQSSAVNGTKVSSPMPGTILKINVKPGDSVKKGDVLLLLEAMKMENEIMAPCDGKIVSVTTVTGASVNAGDALIVIG